MARMDHSSTRGALISQHSTTERERLIADAISDLVAEAEDRRHN
jgi:hypothetical protein